MPLLQFLSPGNRDPCFQWANKRKCADLDIQYAKICKLLWEFADMVPPPPGSPPLGGGLELSTFVAEPPELPMVDLSTFVPATGKVTVQHSLSPRVPSGSPVHPSAWGSWFHRTASGAQFARWFWGQLPLLGQQVLSLGIFVALCAPHLLAHLACAWFRLFCGAWLTEVSDTASGALGVPIKATAQALHIPINDSYVNGWSQVLLPTFISIIVARFYTH